ncbi:hypothetical protein EH223_07945 [candidate division KSB1 bacterium]|nr:AAA family ATPase [candidate division KSB1 bacterium]RQW04124.1 MAG: hypothetical protein EH223_07945 [candidate division KSB1 bacterium]
MAKEKKVDFNDYMKILLKRKWLLISCLLGVLTSVVIINEITPPIYEADTLIVFENLNNPVNFAMPFTSNIKRSFLTNQIEEIKSRSLSFEVYDALPDSIIHTFPLPRRRTERFDLRRFVSKQIQERVSAVTKANSEIIHIRVEAFSPAAAQIIANTITTVLQRRNLDVRREGASNVRGMIEDQLIVYKTALDESEKALKAYKEESKITLVDKEAEEIFRRITEAEVSYNQSQANLQAAEQRLDFIKSRLSERRAEIVPSVTQITSPLASQLKQQLINLEVQVTMLRVQDYSNDHPKIRELEKQIDQAKKNLRDETLKIAQGEDLVDPISEITRYMEQILTLEIEIETYKAQEKALHSVIEEYESRLHTIPDKELHLAQLLRDKNVNEQIYTMLLSKREEAKIVEAEQQGDIRIIDSAQRTKDPIKPKKMLNLFLGVVLASMCAFGLIFLLEYFDASVSTIEEAERITNLNVIGAIPRLDLNSKKRIKKKADVELAATNGKYSPTLVMHYLPQSIEAEAFRTLRTNLQFSLSDLTSKVSLITSSYPSEGKSTIASNLSISTAHMGLKTLLIDADLRKPIQHTLFKLDHDAGLADLVLNPHFFEDKVKSGTAKQVFSEHYNDGAVGAMEAMRHESKNDLQHRIDAIQAVVRKTGIPNLDIITCGQRSSNPAELLNRRSMQTVIDTLRDQYDVVFIDTPPINVVIDAGILSRYVDLSILVIRVGKSNEKDIMRAKSLLKQSKAKSILLVLNHVIGQNGYSKYNYYYSS